MKMYRSQFSYELPATLIAQRPLPVRSGARLLCLDGASGALRDRMIRDLPELVRPGDIMVFNDTRVIPGRLFGHKASGGRVEVLVERVLDERRALVQLRSGKGLRDEACLYFSEGVEARVGERRGPFRVLEFVADAPVADILQRIGHTPLPPYITREDDALDAERYQTIFSRLPGAVAAPTAGLHFDEELLATLRAKGVRTAFISLHVGAGTFQPVRVDDLREHRMHAETVDVPAETCALVHAARADNCRVVAVGTTVVRALETASRDGILAPFAGETDLFITPGYQFVTVDAMVTNFHMPESTLLMLVCAFAGTQSVLAAYRHAVQRAYRFYSYGDAMWLTARPSSRGGDARRPLEASAC